jgi:hypothetical protein
MCSVCAIGTHPFSGDGYPVHMKTIYYQLLIKQGRLKLFHRAVKRVRGCATHPTAGQRLLVSCAGCVPSARTRFSGDA